MPASGGPPHGGSTAVVLVAVSAGGAVGSLARHGVASAVPWEGGGFPWATFLVNVTGAMLLGALVVLTLEVARAQHLRPFLGVGVLGGYTTFSALALETRTLLADGAAALAVGYAAATVLLGALAVVAGMLAARAAVRHRPAAGGDR